MASDYRSDEQLLAAIRGKDVSALEMFYDRHRTMAYSLALRMLGSPLDAEEVVQEAFLNVWRGSGTYQPERSGARSWLLSVVHHRSIDKIRGRQSRVQPVTLDPGVELADSADVWRQVSERLTGQEVRRALELLPAEQRETIELAYFKGYTQTQIADMLAVPLGTVKGRMRIGLHKLRSLLAEPERELAQE